MEACGRTSIKTWNSSIKTMESFHREHGFFPSKQWDSSIKKCDFPPGQAVFRLPKRFKKGFKRDIKRTRQRLLANKTFFHVRSYIDMMFHLSENPGLPGKDFSGGKGHSEIHRCCSERSVPVPAAFLILMSSSPESWTGLYDSSTYGSSKGRGLRFSSRTPSTFF